MKTAEGDSQVCFFCFTSLVVAFFSVSVFSSKELGFLGGGVLVYILNPGGSHCLKNHSKLIKC